jgi:hypothetical protein
MRQLKELWVPYVNVYSMVETGLLGGRVPDPVRLGPAWELHTSCTAHQALNAVLFCVHPRRSIPTTSNDRIYCKILAHNAVHAAFAGYTGITVGLVNTHYVYLPIPVIIQAPRKVDPRGKMWNRLRASIGQPNFV